MYNHFGNIDAKNCTMTDNLGTTRAAIHNHYGNLEVTAQLYCNLTLAVL